MEKTSKYLDLTLKTFLLLIVVVSIFMFEYYISSIQNYALKVEGIEVYNISKYFLITMFSTIISLFIFLFLSLFKISEHNNSKVEKKIYSFLKYIEVSYPTWVFYIMSFLFVFYVTYMLSDIVMILSLGTEQLVTIDKNFLRIDEAVDYFHNSFYLYLIINIGFLLFFSMVKTSKKLNNQLSMSLLLSPSVLFLSILIFFPDFDRYNVYNIDSLISLSITFVVVFFMSKGKLTTKKDIFMIFIGFALSILIMSLSNYCVSKNKTMEIINSNLNIETVMINKKEYTFNKTLSVNDGQNFEKETLIEGYVGLDISNLNNYFEKMSSKDYIGDKEELLHFMSTYYLRNITIFDSKIKNIEKLFSKKMLKNDIDYAYKPYIMNKHYPLIQSQNVLNSVVNGEYQKAVGFYINDIVNADGINALEDKEVKISNKGHPIVIALIKIILDNNLAIIDYGQIKDLKLKEDLFKLLSRNDIELSEDGSDGIKYYIEMFGEIELPFK